MSPMLTVTLVISILLGAGALVVLFCLLSMAQRGDAYLEELELRQHQAGKVIKHVPCRDSGPVYFCAGTRHRRPAEAMTSSKKMLSA